MRFSLGYWFIDHLVLISLEGIKYIDSSLFLYRILIIIQNSCVFVIYYE